MLSSTYPTVRYNGPIRHVKKFSRFDMEPKRPQLLSVTSSLAVMAAVTNNVTDGKSKKSFSTVRFMHISDYVRYLRRKQTVTHLPTPPENDTTLICDMQNIFIWLKVCCVPSICWWLL